MVTVLNVTHGDYPMIMPRMINVTGMIRRPASRASLSGQAGTGGERFDSLRPGRGSLTGRLRGHWARLSHWHSDNLKGRLPSAGACRGKSHGHWHWHWLSLDHASYSDHDEVTEVVACRFRQWPGGPALSRYEFS